VQKGFLRAARASGAPLLASDAQKLHYSGKGSNVPLATLLPVRPFRDSFARFGRCDPRVMEMTRGAQGLGIAGPRPVRPPCKSHADRLSSGRTAIPAPTLASPP